MQKYIINLHTELETWRKVQDHMATLGVNFAGSYWRMIAMGERKLSRQKENAIRAVIGLPERTHRPSSCQRCKARQLTKVVQSMELEALTETARTILLGKPPLGVTQIADMPSAVLKRAYIERVEVKI